MISKSSSAASSVRKRSADGQLEQPCEVKSSTTIGDPWNEEAFGVPVSEPAGRSPLMRPNAAIAATATPITNLRPAGTCLTGLGNLHAKSGPETTARPLGSQTGRQSREASSRVNPTLATRPERPRLHARAGDQSASSSATRSSTTSKPPCQKFGSPRSTPASSKISAGRAAPPHASNRRYPGTKACPSSR